MNGDNLLVVTPSNSNKEKASDDKFTIYVVGHESDYQAMKCTTRYYD